jgi:hypothetical protein
VAYTRLDPLYQEFRLAKLSHQYQLWSGMTLQQLDRTKDHRISASCEIVRIFYFFYPTPDHKAICNGRFSFKIR